MDGGAVTGGKEPGMIEALQGCFGEHASQGIAAQTNGLKPAWCCGTCAKQGVGAIGRWCLSEGDANGREGVGHAHVELVIAAVKNKGSMWPPTAQRKHHLNCGQSCADNVKGCLVAVERLILLIERSEYWPEGFDGDGCFEVLPW